MRSKSLALLLSLCLARPAVAADCGMGHAFNQPDDNGSRNVSVWQGGGALLFGEALHVNTDGTRRSYNVSDFWGETSAINNLCNAMRDACAGLNQDQLRQRRILTQQARAQGWPANLLAATRISSSIIPFRNGRPCPEVNGFLVSATALQAPHISDVCDIASYVDSLTTAAVVLPKRAHPNVPTPFESRGARVGDLAVVMSRDGTQIFYAVVGDLGPANELGEGSVALAGRLLGRTQPPANYREIRGRPPYQGQGWDVSRAYVLILPGTRNAGQPYMSQDRIDAAGRHAFEQWGGRERLAACRTAYSTH
jgi:Fungal chitosanase of glycosyl hydrolase group 75